MPETIFFNIWRTDSREAQQSLISQMRSEASRLVTKPGFLSLTAWASQDDNRVLVEGRWSSRAHFQAAVVENPEANAARAELAKTGRPEPGIFVESFCLGPGQAGPPDSYPPDRTQHLREQASSRWNRLGFETRIIALGDVELFVASAGSGPPVLLLHGYPQSGEIWRLVAPELAKTRRVIIPDLRGMGLSTPADQGYQLAHLASDIHRLLEQFDLVDVDIAAHDWGAAVAAAYALSHPSRVRRLAFIESAVFGAGFESLWRFDKPNPAMTFIPFLLSEPLAETLLVGREEVFLHHLWDTFTHNKDMLPFDAWQPYVEAMKRPGVVRSSACYYRAAYDGAPAIRSLIENGKLTMPVLSVSGQASFGPAQLTFVEAFARNIREHVTVENSGHFVAEEQPEALLAALRSFFAG